jgi:outer membrane protein assembly factor BamB
MPVIMNRITALATLFLFPLIGTAADWPQWLGAKRDGVSTETVLPWQKPLTPTWAVPVGVGHSSPIVAGGVLYLHTGTPEKKVEIVQAIKITDGKTIWSKEYPRVDFSSPFGVGPRATPVLDGKNLYTYGVTGVLAAWEAETGKQLWQVDTLTTYKTANLTFGVSSSPIVVGENVIVMVGGKEASIIAFDKSTGKEVWKILSDRASYASPIVWNDQIVVLTEERLAGINTKTGKLEWSTPFKDALSESSATPVRIQNDSILAGSVTSGSIFVQVRPEEADKDGNSTWKVINRWKKPILTSYFATPIPFGKEYLLMHTGRIIPPASGTLRCVNIATGEIAWSQDKVGKYHASLMRLADSKMLTLDDDGNLTLIEANDRKYEALSTQRLFKARGDAWAHPALSDGVLYVRDNSKLYAFAFPKSEK